MAKNKSFEDLKQAIKSLLAKVDQAFLALDFDSKKNQLQDLKHIMAQHDFWQDQDKVKNISSQASVLTNQIKAWQDLKSSLSDLNSLSLDKQAEDLLDDLKENFSQLESQYDNLSAELYWQGKYDGLPAIITINAGAGGVDAQDWAEMLERMYLRFAEQKSWTVNYFSRSPGSEAGIKSSTFKLAGQYAYGHLKNEAGVHRLVRISPYDSDHARHTSFAMVQVLPQIEETDIEIKDDDLKIDTFRASGHGGQSVNKTDSAVRITHLPTGLSAGCQNERSQAQNKKQAMAYLKSKIEQYYQTEKEEVRQALRGEYTEAAWGNQIRSYVIHPYKLVKDHRSGFELKDPEAILGGDLMPLIKNSLDN
ncbi:MAG: peptide chain release factor 2, partial [bacterium]|nr:peptide chain release factor 2 [bacterium]